jgi:hypothetical protein
MLLDGRRRRVVHRGRPVLLELGELLLRGLGVAAGHGGAESRAPPMKASSRVYFRHHGRRELFVLYAIINVGLFLALVVIDVGDIGTGVAFG